MPALVKIRRKVRPDVLPGFGVDGDELATFGAVWDWISAIVLSLLSLVSTTTGTGVRLFHALLVPSLAGLSRLGAFPALPPGKSSCGAHARKRRGQISRFKLRTSTGADRNVRGVRAWLGRVLHPALKTLVCSR